MLKSCKALRAALALTPIALVALPAPQARAQGSLPACSGKPAGWDGCVGTRRYNDGGVYEGEFRGGLRHGRGTYTFANGDVYSGDFAHDRQTGSGTYTTRDGEKHAGRFRDGQRDGYFTITSPGGARTVANFRDGLPVDNLPGTSAHGGGRASPGGSAYGTYGAAMPRATMGGAGRAGAIGDLISQGSQYMTGGDSGDQGAQSERIASRPSASSSGGGGGSVPPTRLQVASSQPVGGGGPAPRPAPGPAARPVPQAQSGPQAQPAPQVQPAPRPQNTQLASAQPAGGVPAQASRNTASQPQPAVTSAKAAPVSTSKPALSNANLAALQTSQRKVALVIGNSSYKFANPLANPKNDATDMAKMLKAMGFTVVSGTDLTRDGMTKTIRSFLNEVEKSDLALFFYAGHGIQVSGSNYLIPIDAQVQDSSALDFELVNIDSVTGHMGGTNKVGIVLLDACRNNPFTNSLTRNQGTRAVQVSKGLAQIASPAGGLLVAFATAPGDVAADGGASKRNSPFTTALLEQMPQPGLEIELIMKRVKAEVISQTGNSQRPWHNSDLATEVYLTRKD